MRRTVRMNVLFDQSRSGNVALSPKSIICQSLYLFPFSMVLSAPVVFNTTVDEATAGFNAQFTLLCVVFSWSPSSRELYNAVREIEAELPLQVRFLDGDTALDFCTKNTILWGAGGVQIYSGGRACCFRRANSGSVYTITTPLMRPSQIKELVDAVVEANKTESIASISF